MTDSVKFIFKTLIKVPIIIVVSYFLFNLFAFLFTYFRMVGLSYVAMQTAIENNYIPNKEMNILQNYADTMQTTWTQDSSGNNTIEISCDTGSGNNRVQYGRQIKVQVGCDFLWTVPLMKKDGTRKAGLNEDQQAYVATQRSDREMRDHNLDNKDITITYVVPGLKYYPDLS